MEASEGTAGEGSDLVGELLLGAPTIPGIDFQIPVEVLALGAVTGLTYSMLAVGLVLVYRSSRVLNFAHGEMGALPAGLVPVLVIVHAWPYWLALPAALAVGVAAGALTEFLVIRRLEHASRLVALVATIGVSQVFFALGTFIPKGQDLGSATYPVPFSATVNVGTLRLTAGQLLILVVVPLVTLALGLFFQRTKLGIASRAAAENRDAARLVGMPVHRIATAVWVIAGLTAAVGSILLGPTQPIVQTEALGPGLLLRTLAAAMIGGLMSLPWAFIGGIVVGVVELLMSWNYATGGMMEVALFGLILLSFVLRRGLAQAGSRAGGTTWSLAGSIRSLDPRLAAVPAVRRLRLLGPWVLVAIAAVVPMTLSTADQVLTSSMVLFALMGLSLVVLTGYAGQVSLGQFAFVALGAVVAGRLLQLGYPHWVGLLYAMAAGGGVALVVGIPALRVRGLFLAVATLGFAVAANAWIYNQDWLVSVEGGTSSLMIPRPSWASDELTYYWICLAAFVLVAVAVRRLKDTGVGRAMMAVRDNEDSARTLSIPPRRVKLTAFVLSGAIAGLGGYLYGGLLVNFSANVQEVFAPALSLVLLAMVILGGVTTVTGVVVGAVFVRGIGRIFEGLLPELVGASVALIVSGLGLLAAVLHFPGGVASELFALRERAFKRLAGWREEEERLADSARDQGLPRPQLAPRTATDASGAGVSRTEPELATEDVTVTFGGNTAVDRASIQLAPQEVVGLVGPNGAGKTTLFDVLSGHLRADTGRVRLRGEDVTRLRPEQRALLGLGRTFQRADLFADMTVLDVFKVALEREDPSEVVPSIFGFPPARLAERRKDLRAEEFLELLGLDAVAHLRSSELSTGMRRIVELGTVTAVGAEVLLLDEPTAGIAQREVEAFQPVLDDIRVHLGASVLVVEHDIPLLTRLVDRLYVMAAGEVIAEGPPEQLREDPRVVAAYLGSDEALITRSGEAPTAVGSG